MIDRGFYAQRGGPLPPIWLLYINRIGDAAFIAQAPAGRFGVGP